MSTYSPQALLHFWFHASTPEQWFTKDPLFDQALRQRFLPTLKAAAQGECYHWRHTIHGRLAEIILLDQLSRNIWRDTPQAFSQDAMALTLAQELVSQPAYTRLNETERRLVLMPFMHSESVMIHKKALVLFEELGNEQVLHYELLHKRIIDRFGRYPHRNAILGRRSTAEELAFLQEPNSSF